VSRDERRRNRVGRVGMTFDRALGGTQDLALTAFVEPKVLQRSERGRFRDFTRYHTGGSAIWSGRLPVREGLDARWSVGGDEAFQDGSILFYNLDPDGSRSTVVRANKREAANSAGLFAQGELRWNERWRFGAAARYDALWYISEDRIDPALNDDKRFERVTPKASIAYAFDRHTVFAAFGGGVEAPAFNEIDPPPYLQSVTGLNPFLDPMVSTTGELGFKGLIDAGAIPGAMSYDAALYWIEVRNDIVPHDGGAYFETAGRTRRQGLELGLRWTPVPRVTLTGSLNASNNEYREYQSDTTATDDGNYEGRKMAGVPDLLFSGGLDVRLPAGFEAALGVQAVDGYYADDANTLRVQNHAVLDASLAWERLFGGRRVRAFVSGANLTGADYAESVFINPVPNADPQLIRYLEPGMPQSWAAGLTFRFE
jgi:iron complex outermembrane receptor protein